MVKLHVTPEDIDKATERLIKALDEFVGGLKEEHVKRIKEISNKVKEGKGTFEEVAKELKEVILEAASG